MSTNKLFVGGLDFEATLEDLEIHFSRIGNVARVTLPQDREREGNRNRGFGFVEMESIEDAEEAVRVLHAQPGPCGRRISVRFDEKASPRREGRDPRQERRSREEWKPGRRRDHEQY